MRVQLNAPHSRKSMWTYVVLYLCRDLFDSFFFVIFCSHWKSIVFAEPWCVDFCVGSKRSGHLISRVISQPAEQAVKQQQWLQRLCFPLRDPPPRSVALVSLGSMFWFPLSMNEDWHVGGFSCLTRGQSSCFPAGGLVGGVQGLYRCLWICLSKYIDVHTGAVAHVWINVSDHEHNILAL